MRVNCSKRRDQALTLIEVLAVVVATGIFAAVLLTVFSGGCHKPMTVYCLSNLKQIGLAYRVWASDNNDKFPMEVAVTNGGARELVLSGNVVGMFQVISNALGKPKVLHCPQDRRHEMASDFGPDFTAKNISYFAGVDASSTNFQTILSGDADLVIGGMPVSSGRLYLATNSSIGWTNERHGKTGNIGLADGGARLVTMENMHVALQETGLVTNRFAIP